MMEEVITLIQGPAGATALMSMILWWLANRVLPVLTKYFDGHNEKLGQLVSALEKTVDAHERDRETFTQTIAGITTRLDVVEGKVEFICNKIVSQN